MDGTIGCSTEDRLKIIDVRHDAHLDLSNFSCSMTVVYAFYKRRSLLKMHYAKSFRSFILEIQSNAPFFVLLSLLPLLPHISERFISGLFTTLAGKFIFLA